MLDDQPDDDQPNSNNFTANDTTGGVQPNNDPPNGDNFTANDPTRGGTLNDDGALDSEVLPDFGVFEDPIITPCEFASVDKEKSRQTIGLWT
ncbi:hypothetical protein WN943_018950 [Citrus x changshan-huyou]